MTRSPSTAIANPVIGAAAGFVAPARGLARRVRSRVVLAGTQLTRERDFRVHRSTRQRSSATVSILSVSHCAELLAVPRHVMSRRSPTGGDVRESTVLGGQDTAGRVAATGTPSLRRRVPWRPTCRPSSTSDLTDWRADVGFVATVVVVRRCQQPRVAVPPPRGRPRPTGRRTI